MSTGSNPQLSEQKIEQIRRRINQLFDEVAQLTDKNLEPAQFYGEFLQRVLNGMAAPAGAVWVRTSLGHLQLQFQVNLQHVALDKSEAGRQCHDELLRQTCLAAKPQILPPHSGAGGPEDGTVRPGNPTDFAVLLAPMIVDGVVVGLLEVWQDARHSAEALPGFLQFVVRMAGLASLYVRNLQLRQLVGQQQVWEGLEQFARQVHTSLNPTEVAYHVANQGRRLVSCDRLSVAIREGRTTVIEAVSGADVVEKRSSLIQLQRKLAEKVAAWGERLVYQGTKDESLPPDVLHALDAYLAEANSKFLVVQPLRDDREKDSQRPPRSTLILESFEPAAAPEQMLARMEVVGRHAGPALYNAAEHRRIPLRFLWLPLAKLQEGLGSKTRAIVAAVAAAVAVLLVVLVIVPYPLKMDANGHLLPEDRRWVFAPVEAKVVDFPSYVYTGSTVQNKQTVIEMYGEKLQLKLIELRSEIAGAEGEIGALRQQFTAAQTPSEKLRITAEQKQKEVLLMRKKAELDSLLERTEAAEDRPGYFSLKAPIGGYVLNSDFRENLINRTVKPSEPLLRIGDKDKGWEIELDIPQRHIGQVLLAFEGKPSDYELDVDLLLASAPTQTYKGKLARGKISGEANPNKDDPNNTDPVVRAWVRIDGPGIAREDQLPPELLVTGTVVHAKIRCGNRAMGYSLFYGVWEFVYEKGIFFLF